MTTRISTDTVPSLRQHMINEALDYHQNMNSVVFARTAQSVAFNNNPSGKTDPSQGDIVSNAEIKKRISEIAQSIQKLNQTIGYATGSEPAFDTKDAKATGSGKGGKRGKNPLIQELEEEKYGVEEEKESKEDDPRQPLPFRPAPPDMQRRRRVSSARKDTRAIEAMRPRYEALNVPDYATPPQTGPYSVPERGDSIPRQGVAHTPQYYQDLSKSQSQFLKDTLADYQASLGGPPGPGGPPGGPPGPPSGFAPFNPLRAMELEPFSRPDSHSPKVSNKIQALIDNTLASIVASYNSLIVYIDSLISQRTFKQREENETATALKELINPLKLVIANAATLAADRDIANQQAYSRIYNIVSSIITKISSCPPFLKVDTGLLTEPIPLRRDMINAPNFDAEKALNHTYLKSLMDRLDDAQDKQLKTSPKSPIEKEARELKISQITALRRELTQAGYKTSAEHADTIARRLQGLEQDIHHIALKPHEEYAITEHGILGLQLPYATDYEATRRQEVMEALDQDIEGVNSDIKETNQDIRDTAQKLKSIATERRDAELFEEDIEDSARILNRYRDVVAAVNQLRSEQHTMSPAGYARHHSRLLDELQDLQLQLDTVPHKTFQDLEAAQRELADYYDDTTARKNQYETELSNLKVRKVSLNQERAAMKARISQASKAHGPAYRQKEAILKRMIPLSAAVPSYQARIKETDELEKQRKKLAEKVAFHQEHANRIPEPELQKAIKAKRRPRGSGKVGGHVHKASADPFGDNNKLEPYLTKYLRPSKFRNNVPAIESSSDESSDGENDEPQKIPRPTGGKRGKKKAVEDWEIIETSIHPDKAVLVEKKLKTKRIGSGKKLETTKPVHTMRPEQDLWFMN